eukprot:SAG31_NODE_6186_length_2132_cov_1.652238_3_plen_282_part_00
MITRPSGQIVARFRNSTDSEVVVVELPQNHTPQHASESKFVGSGAQTDSELPQRCRPALRLAAGQNGGLLVTLTTIFAVQWRDKLSDSVSDLDAISSWPTCTAVQSEKACGDAPGQSSREVWFSISTQGAQQISVGDAQTNMAKEETEEEILDERGRWLKELAAWRAVGGKVRIVTAAQAAAEAEAEAEAEAAGATRQCIAPIGNNGQKLPLEIVKHNSRPSWAPHILSSSHGLKTSAERDAWQLHDANAVYEAYRTVFEENRLAEWVAATWRRLEHDATM